jgi:hypothetical protein
MGLLPLGRRPQLGCLYRNHAAANAEAACQIPAQSPSEKSKAASSPAPGISFVAAAATARQSFEANGTLVNMNVSTTGAPTNVLDLVDTQPSSITSAMVANGNTIELFNGPTMIDHFALAGSVGTAAVHWAPDAGSGTNIFLSV